MSVSISAKRVFGFLSCASLAGVIVTFSPGALAACPDPDPSGPLAHKNPAAIACTDADMVKVDTALQNVMAADGTWDDFKAALDTAVPACAACVFTAEGAAPGAFTMTAQGVLRNFGACFERGPSGNAVCGATVDKFSQCLHTRCDACADDDAWGTCADTVASDVGSCGQYDYETDCAAGGDALADLCFGNDYVAIIEAVCGGATAPSTPDAGTSSSGSSGTNDDDDDDDNSSSSSSSSSGSSGESSSSSSSSSGSSGGKKKSSSSSSSGAAEPTEGDPESTGGCAQGPGSAGSSIASVLVLATAVGAVATRRRRKH